MDTAAFAAALDGVFDGPISEGKPADPRFAGVAEEVAGFSTPAELAVLNLAARMLPEGEAYLEVGTFKGRSLCGALLDAPDRTYVAVENYSEFGMHAAAARAELDDHLARFAARDITLHDADCFALLGRPGVLPQPVGVYFYDGSHGGLAHYLALGVVEPLLADEALVLVDDATLPIVADTTRRYLARHPGWEVLRDIRTPREHDPIWGNGLLILSYRRPAGAPRRMAADVRWRRPMQTRLRGPVRALAMRTLSRFPQLMPVVHRLRPKGPRTVQPEASVGTGDG
jgi:predicted O-methyltransferase YrrM